MAKKSTSPLPDRLLYLEPLMKSLEKLKPDEINEDFDLSEVEKVVRSRIKGLSRTSIRKEIDADRAALEQWIALHNRTNHPGFWLLGVLSSPHLLYGVTRLPEPPPRAPVIYFEAPEGWNVEPVPFALNMKKGKLIAVIQSISKDMLNLQLMQKKAAAKPPDLSRVPPEIAAQLKTLKIDTRCTDVKFGESIGKKYVLNQTAPCRWKRVDYLLTVSGGHVTVILDALGSDFDESPIENKLLTLRIC